jgi:predicted NBD/HSP70 family sugar kinase
VATVDRARPLSHAELDVTRLLLMHGPSSRAALGERLAFSPASMTRLTRALLDLGIVLENGDGEERPPGPGAGAGRPAKVLSINPAARTVLGCKLTADTAYVVVCDLAGDVLASAKAPLPQANRDGEVPVAKVVSVVARLARKLPRGRTLDAVGISLGGIVRPDGVVQEGSFLGWRDVDLTRLLRERLDVPVITTNDVTALVREQLWLGAGRGRSTFGIVTVGAGIGIGVVREGVVVERLVDNGQLLTHSPVDGRGPRCGIGHRGCVSSYLDQWEIKARAAESFGRPMSFDDVVAAAAQGDRRATSLLDAAARALGHLVATLAGALQTDRILLAGEGVEPVASRPAMRETIADRMQSGPGNTATYELDVSIEPLTFEDWARGAAVTASQFALAGR